MLVAALLVLFRVRRAAEAWPGLLRSDRLRSQLARRLPTIEGKALDRRQGPARDRRLESKELSSSGIVHTFDPRHLLTVKSLRAKQMIRWRSREFDSMPAPENMKKY